MPSSLRYVRLRAIPHWGNLFFRCMSLEIPGATLTMCDGSTRKGKSSWPPFTLKKSRGLIVLLCTSWLETVGEHKYVWLAISWCGVYWGIGTADSLVFGLHLQYTANAVWYLFNLSWLHLFHTVLAFPFNSFRFFQCYLCLWLVGWLS